MGMSSEEALTYTENLYGIPDNVRTDIHNTGDLARYVALQVEAKYRDLQGMSPVNTDLTATDYASATIDHVMGKLVELDHTTATAVLNTIYTQTGMPSEAYVLTQGAHGLVGLAHGGSAAGMIVGPQQPVVIGEGLSREAVVPFDDFGDMTATIRNTGRASDFVRAAIAAGGDAPGMTAWAAATPAPGGAHSPLIVQLTVDRKVLAEVLVDPVSAGIIRNQKTGRRDLGVRRGR
jgi:hypothetical protein